MLVLCVLLEPFRQVPLIFVQTVQLNKFQLMVNHAMLAKLELSLYLVTPLVPAAQSTASPVHLQLFVYPALMALELVVVYVHSVWLSNFLKTLHVLPVQLELFPPLVPLCVPHALLTALLAHLALHV